MRLAFVLFFGFLSFADCITFSLVPREVVLERLHSCPKKDLEREHELQGYFSHAGCKSSDLTIDQPKHAKYGNVVCTLPGTSPEVIVVGAHFDHVEAGAGAVDNWSGASLLPSLYEAIAKSPRKHTFVFASFYGEEQGMVGSKKFLQDRGKQGLGLIVAMINLDTLGLGPTEVWRSHADPTLATLAFAIARVMKLPLSALNVDNVGSTDSESFREKKIPSITFHTLTQDTLHILHSKDDQLSQIKENHYVDTYRLITAYLVYLDTALAEHSRP